MLRSINISNYALISDLQISFENGFSVITGETGAGKSIILGALSLIMGQRADSKSISEGAQKCVIEAEFDISNYDLQACFDENDIDFDPNTCIIRRELSVNGKSRSFVNDTPAGLTILKELSQQLIDIHSQHENLLFNSNLFQLNIVDIVAQNAAERQKYAAAYSAHKSVVRKLSDLQELEATQKADFDYISFQFEQLSEANLQAGELEELEYELNQLNHSEEIITELQSASGRMHADEQGVLSGLKECQSAIRKIEKYLPEAEKLSERLESTYIELKDISEEIENLSGQAEYNPQRQQQVEERVNLLNNLLQKHRVRTTDELMALCNDFEQKLQRIASFDEEIAALEQEQELLLNELLKSAKELRHSRKNVIPQIESQIESQLALLGIPHPKFEVKCDEVAFPMEHGADDVQFLFSANKNQALKNVTQVASGGEISRLMLCVKSLTASTKTLPTIIFDEIDTGVSGEVADKMGNIMTQMGADMQVLSITHLPQIAAKGAAHYKVYKRDEADRTITHIRQLSNHERITEIAQMLSGSNITDAAIENAKNLCTFAP